MTGPVLLAVSGSAASFHAARAAVDLHGDRRTYVLVHAAVTVEHDERARQVLDGASRVVSLCAEHRVVVGARPGPALCALAAEMGASELVIGARRGSGAWKHPVAAHVLRHAPCPVLLVVLTASDRSSAPAIG